MRLIFFGDSLTWGGYGGDFVAIIARRLPHHEIINAGVGGNTIVNLLRRVTTDVIDRQPDGVFVMIGGNDSIAYVQPATRPYYRKAQGLPEGFVPPDTFAQTYRELLTRLQLEHIQVWIGLAPAEYNPEVVRAKREYNAIAADVARSMNIPVLDFQEHFTPIPVDIPDRPPLDLNYIDLIGRRGREKWSDYEGERQRHGYTYSFDGLHFTPETAQRAADLIIAFLELG
jgi:lysophospholipase L1-like esterase